MSVSPYVWSPLTFTRPLTDDIPVAPRAGSDFFVFMLSGIPRLVVVALVPSLPRWFAQAGESEDKVWGILFSGARIGDLRQGRLMSRQLGVQGKIHYCFSRENEVATAVSPHSPLWN